MKRALEVYEILRRAQAEGHAWERTELAGRPALRIRRSDGTELQLMSPEQLAELEVLLERGPPRLQVRGLPDLVWDGSKQVYAAMDGPVEVLIDAEPPGPEGPQLDTLVRLYQQLCAQHAHIRNQVAARLLQRGAPWDGLADAESLAKGLELRSVTLEPERSSVHAFMSAGEAFWGHFVEVWFDETGRIVEAAVTG